MELRGRTVLVVGAGKSGVAAANFCASRGANVVLTDKKTPDVRIGPRISCEFGGHNRESFVRTNLIVLSPGIPPLAEVEEARGRGVEITGEIELASRFIEAPIVAVTGTNGKSTVTALAGEIAKQTGRPTFVGGNLGTPLITCVDEPASLPGGIVVVELSSFQLETCESFHPRAAALLNLTPDHLDRYKSLKEYGAAKLRIARNMTKSDALVVNAEDEYFREKLRDRTPLFYATHQMQGSAGFIDGDQLKVVLDEKSELGEKSESYPIAELQLVGRHNQSNALAALLLMRGSGLASYEQARAGLKSFRALPHRMQLVGEKKGVRFYDDSKATNVESVVAGIEGFPTPFVLIAGGRDKGAPYTTMVEAMKRSECLAAILIGEAADQIAAAVGREVPLERADTLEDAVRRGASIAKAGQSVVLSPACSSYDMFENYEHRGRVFRAAVEAL